MFLELLRISAAEQFIQLLHVIFIHYPVFPVNFVGRLIIHQRRFGVHQQQKTTLEYGIISQLQKSDLRMCCMTILRGKEHYDYHCQRYNSESSAAAGDAVSARCEIERFANTPRHNVQDKIENSDVELRRNIGYCSSAAVAPQPIFFFFFFAAPYPGTDIFYHRIPVQSSYSRMRSHGNVHTQRDEYFQQALQLRFPKSNKPRYPLEHQLSPSNIAEVVVTPLQRCHSITEGQSSLSSTINRMSMLGVLKMGHQKLQKLLDNTATLKQTKLIQQRINYYHLFIHLFNYHDLVEQIIAVELQRCKSIYLHA